MRIRTAGVAAAVVLALAAAGCGGSEPSKPAATDPKDLKADLTWWDTSDPKNEGPAFQELITRYAWGDVWSRPGLSRRERSVATLAALVTLGAEREIAMHVRAAIRNGLTRDEIGEVLLHTALYAGLPRAGRAFAIATEVLDAPDVDGQNG